MRDREPYNIQRVVIVYNLLQTLLSLWIWLRTASFWLTGRYNWLCQPVDYSGGLHILYLVLLLNIPVFNITECLFKTCLDNFDE